MTTPITFPNLGISVTIDPVAFTLGSFSVHWYGIIIGCGFLLAVLYAHVRCKQFGLTEDNILTMLLWAVPAALICARIYYVVFYWELYKDDPISALYIWEGGIAIYGAVIGAVTAAWLYCRKAKIPFGAMGDLGALGLLIGQGIGRWGNFVNQEAHGGITDSFFKMGLVDSTGSVAYYHPAFLYESVWNLLGFVILHFYSKHRKYDGEIFTLYIAWYGLGRGFIEGLRTDSLMLFNTGIRVSQLLGFVSCAVALWLWLYTRLHKKPTADALFVNRKAAEAASEMDASAAEDE